MLKIYKITKDFLREEKYGFVANLRRSAASIPTNLVEGFKRKSKKEFAYFINIADGPLKETKYHILLVKDLGYIKGEDFNKLNDMRDEIGRMLYGFQKKLTTYDL